VSDAGTCTCGGRSEVLETRPTAGGAIRRGRRCVTCDARWSTREVRAPEHDVRGVRLVAVPRKAMTAGEALALVAELCREVA
jgi:transcriptional regulator NrdR family protein